jgi:hypothetical protein
LLVLLDAVEDGMELGTDADAIVLEPICFTGNNELCICDDGYPYSWPVSDNLHLIESKWLVAFNCPEIRHLPVDE